MELIEFFEQDLSDIIELYYKINKEICNNKIKFKTLEINLSDKTKTFHNLLEKDKYRIKKDKLLWIIDQDYIQNKLFYLNLFKFKIIIIYYKYNSTYDFYQLKMLLLI